LIPFVIAGCGAKILTISFSGEVALDQYLRSVDWLLKKVQLNDVVAWGGNIYALTDR
jgi:hypothetical protein